MILSVNGGVNVVPLKGYMGHNTWAGLWPVIDTTENPIGGTGGILANPVYCSIAFLLSSLYIPTFSDNGLLILEVVTRVQNLFLGKTVMFTVAVH